MKNVESLLKFIKAEIERQEDIIELVAGFSRNPTSTTTSGNEQIFNRHVLQPTIDAYFSSDFDKDQMQTGLLSEGLSQPHVKELLPNHGEPPKSSSKFFYTKESLNQRLPPTSWRKGQKVRANRSYPDFAIKPPLLNKA
jgi:hypothetical protein